MPAFDCHAIGANGRPERLQIQAETARAAAAEIRARGWMVVSIEEDMTARFLDSISPGRLLPVSTRDRVLFFRMLSTLLRSEVTITQALRILRDQSERANLQHVLADVVSRVEGGVTVSEAMSAHPRLFPDTVVNMVRAGEMAGILEMVFSRVADLIERRWQLRKKLFMSFFYPGIVFVVGIGVVAFLAFFVIPRFVPLLQGNVPPITQLLLDVTGYIQHNGLYLLGYLIAVPTGVILLHSMPVTRYYMDRGKIYLPVVGPVIRLGMVVGFARTFGVLLESRIPMVEALRATAATLSNTALQEAIERMAERVMGGEPLSASLRNQWAFTPVTHSMAGIGEISGLMSESMITVADVHERMLEDRIARMSAMVEPALIITLGVLVGTVVYALISGVMAMYANFV